MTGIPDDAILDNLLEAYDISNDFRKHEHEHGHSNKVYSAVFVK